MAKVFKILNDRQNKKMIKNSDELVKERKETIIGKEEIMFSLDVEKMITNIKRQSVLEEIERLIDKNESIRGWKKEEILENLKYIWDNTYCTIEDQIVNVVNGLSMESKMSPELAELIMKRWEEEKVDKVKNIRKFDRYVDDSLDIWKGKKNELKEKLKELEDKSKGIKLKLEVEKKRKLHFWI